MIINVVMNIINNVEHINIMFIFMIINNPTRSSTLPAASVNFAGNVPGFIR